MFVTEGHSGESSEVDIRFPAGKVSVRSEADARATGMPVYPGARPARDRDEQESAHVNIGTAWFGVKVVAAKFESSDAPQRVLDFYKNEMKTYGRVTECRGDVDFKVMNGTKQPVCEETRSSSTDVELIAGTEERQRIVAVKPRGSGSEFSLVYVETRGDN